MTSDTGNRYNEIEHLRNMTDEQAHANALSDPDNPPLTDAQMKGFVHLSDYEGNTFSERLQGYKKSLTKATSSEAALSETSLPPDSDTQEKGEWLLKYRCNHSLQFIE